MIAVTGHTTQEVEEIKNHWNAVLALRNMVTNRTKITVETIRYMHKEVMGTHEHTGKYRDEIQKNVRGSLTQFPDYREVPREIELFVEWMNSEEQANKHTILAAVDADLKYVTIHPFHDGNGRVARLLMNLIAMQRGYPIFWFNPELKGLYKAAVHQAQISNDSQCLHRMALEAASRSLDYYLALQDELF